MRKTSTAEPGGRRPGAERRRPPVEIRVRSRVRAAVLSPGAVRRVAREVLIRERRVAGSASRRLRELSVTFLSRPAIQRLNHEWLGHARPTDVLAFALPDPDGKVVGDVYICPAQARAAARRLGIRPREELTRLVVHGVLHVLGYDHPEGPARTASAMWRRQERYLTVLA